MTSRPVYPDPYLPLCPHLGAVKVQTRYLDQIVTHHVWCPDCDPDCKTPLPANWRRPCCHTEPETPHLYNCAGKVPLRPPQPQPAAKPQRAPAYRPPRPRRRWPAVLFPLVAAAVLAAVLLAVNLAPRGPEPWTAADAQVCATWAAQGASVPEGNGVSYMGDYTDPGYKQLTDAEDALMAELGPDVNTTLSGQIQTWMADAESSYVMVHGDWGFLNFGSDRDGITAWCRDNRYA